MFFWSTLAIYLENKMNLCLDHADKSNCLSTDQGNQLKCKPIFG